MAYFKKGALIERTTVTATSGGTLTLTTTSTTFHRLTGVLNHTVVLPVGTTMDAGQKFVFLNRSIGLITIKLADTTTVLGFVPPGTDRVAQIYDVSTSNGVWDLSFGEENESPFRLYAASPADAKLYIAANKSTAADGAEKSAPPVKNSIPDYPLTTINFQTGAITGGTVNITFPSVTAGRYIRLGLSYISGNSIQANFSADTASLGALADPGTLFVSSGLPIGWIDLQGTGTTTFKTADSATSVVETQVAGSPRIHRFGAGGGTGSAGDSGASKTPADGFKAVVADEFDDLPADATSKVDSTLTTATQVTAGDVKIYEMKCDKTKTITTVGTALTLSGAPTGFALAVGNVIWSGGVFRRVATVLTTSTGTIDAAFSPDLTTAAGMVAQALWTKDLVNYGSATEKTRLRDFFPSTAIDQLNIAYLDSLIVSDSIGDQVDTARVVVAGSNEGLQASVTTPLTSTYAAEFTRPISPNQINNYPLLANANRERLFLVFFPNPANASVTTQANVISYEASVYTQALLSNGGYLNSAYCMSDSTGTPNNCVNPTVVSGKTRVQLNFNFVPDVNSGKPDGDLEVIVEGKPIPRYFAGVVGEYYTEVPGVTDVVEFSGDLSSYSFSLHIRRRQGTNDTSSQNSLRLNALYQAIVGSATQVTSGLATHSSLQAAHDSFSSAGSILMLLGTVTENVTWTKSNLSLCGRGRGSQLTGTLTLSSGAVGNIIDSMKVTGTLTLAVGADGNFVSKVWIGTGSILDDQGAGNSTGGYIQE